MKRKIKSRETAVENIRRLFSNNSKSDTISLVDAFKAWGRPNPENLDKNKAWLSNMLYHIKYHGLITPIYSYINGRRKITKLQLTLKGKESLGRLGDVSDQKVQARNDLSMNDIFKLVAQWKDEHQEYEVKLDVRLKDIQV